MDINRLPEMNIPYYEETQKRTVRQKLKKIKNSILASLAYSCPASRYRILLHRWRGVHIGKNVYIGSHCFIDNLYPDYIYIDDNSSINADCMILTHFNPMQHFAPVLQARVAPVIIGKGSVLSVRSTVLPGVTIGEFAIVSAGSVVEKDVPAYTIVRGNPAKIISEFEILMK